MEQHRFSNMDELNALSASLDLCRREESWFKDPKSGQFISDPERRDIINLDTGKRSAVVSKVYHEYQHADVINEVALSFKKAGIEAHGYVNDMGDRIDCAVFFDNIEGIRDPTSSKGIKIGARFRNSYNKQNSVTGAGYFVRMDCINQMYVGNMIHELKFSERHTGSIVNALPQSIADFTDNLLMRSKLVETSVKIASEVKVEFITPEQRKQTMIAIVDHTRVGELVDNNLKTLDLTKWDVYNAITAATTHERMADSVRDRVEKVSERVLSPTYTIFPAVLA